MISQSENNIKKAALRFLKMYYKHRPRAGKTDIKVNQTTQDGIIADGLLSFPKEEGNHFVAAVEATSFDTRDEVKYKMEYRLLNWDAFMWGCVAVALVVLFGHYFKILAFSAKDWSPVILISSIFIFSFLVYRKVFGKRSKYRYIYALKQFLQYHADEQWVAIGDNVFYGADDPAFEELRRQCVRSGFGLLSIDKELNAHLVISPAREELFGSQRKILNFVGVNTLAKSKSLSLAKGWWGSLKAKLGIVSKDVSLLRYRRKFYKPVFASMLLLGLIGYVAYQDLRDKDFDYVKNEQKYNEQLSEITKNKPFNEFDQSIDTIFVQPVQRKKPDSYLSIVEKDKREGFLRQRAPLQKKEKLTTKGGSKEIYVDSDGEKLTSYDCTRFFNFFGKKYVIQDGIFTDLESAERRLNLLRRSGVKANLMWLGCFYKDSQDYLIYIEWLYDDKKEAIREGGIFRKKLRKEKIKEKELVIRVLEK